MRILALLISLAVESFAGHFWIIHSNSDGSELYFRSDLPLKETKGGLGGTFVWSAQDGIRATTPVPSPQPLQAPVYEASEDRAVTAELEPRQPPFCFSCGTQFSDFTIIRGVPGSPLRVEGVVRLSASGRFALVSPSSYSGALAIVPFWPKFGDIKLMDLFTGDEQLVEPNQQPIRTASGRVVTDEGTAVYSRGTIDRQFRDLVVATWKGEIQGIHFEQADGGEIDTAGDFVVYRKGGEVRGWHLKDGWDSSFGSTVFGLFGDLRWFASTTAGGITIVDRHTWTDYPFRSEPRLISPAALAADGSTFFYESATGIVRLSLKSGGVERVVTGAVVQRRLPGQIIAGRDYPITMPVHEAIRTQDWQVRVQPRNGPPVNVSTFRREDSLWFTVPRDAASGTVRVELLGSDAVSPFAPSLEPADVQLIGLVP